MTYNGTNGFDVDVADSAPGSSTAQGSITFDNTGAATIAPTQVTFADGTIVDIDLAGAAPMGLITSAFVHAFIIGMAGYLYSIVSIPIEAESSTTK